MDKPQSGEQLVKVRAVADTISVSPGQTFQIAFIFDIEPGWHIYWQNPGASGGPTEIKISGPQGFTIGKARFPRPIVLHGEEGETYGYEGQTVLFVEIVAPVELSSGAAMFSAEVNWLVCKGVCLMGKARPSVSVPTVSSNPATKPTLPSTPDAEVVKKYRNRLPKPLKDEPGASTKFDGKLLTLILPSQGKRTATFFPIELPGVTYGKVSVSPEGENLSISVEVEVNPSNSRGRPMKVCGVVALGDQLDEPCFEFEMPASPQ